MFLLGRMLRERHIYENASAKNLTVDFNNKTKKQKAAVKGETTWEKEFSAISSIFIPAKEILSNSFNLTADNNRDRNTQFLKDIFCFCFYVVFDTCTDS